MQNMDVTIIHDFLLFFAEVYSNIETAIGPIPTTALFYIVGIYIFVHFYDIFFNRLSKREIFRVELKPISTYQKYSDASINQLIRFLVKNILFFPILALIIAIVTTIFLILMSTSQSVSTAASISVAIVIVVRILAYTNERLSNEIAKLLPFGLLIVIITNPASFAQEDLIIKSNELVSSTNSLIPMFFTFIAVEMVLQPIMQLQSLAQNPKEKRKKTKNEIEQEDDEFED